MGLGRQSLLLLWLLSGEYIQIDGYSFNAEPMDRILRKLQSSVGIPALEGYEWSNLQNFNIYKTKAFVRIAGSAEPTSAFHDLFIKQQHDAGKAAIRTVFAKMVAHPALNVFVTKVRRSANDELPDFALDGSLGLPDSFPAFDTDACLSILTPDPAQWSTKPCSGFEDYIASAAGRTVLLGLPIFTAQEIYDVVHKFWRVKGDVPLPGRKDIRNEAEANQFLALAGRFIDEALLITKEAYDAGMGAAPDDERLQRENNLKRALTETEKKKKNASLQIVPRVSNLGFKAANDVPVVMYRGTGTAAGTRVKPRASDQAILVSLEGGDIQHLSDLNELVSIEDDSADRNLLDSEILVPNAKKDYFQLGDENNQGVNPVLDQGAELGVVKWVSFTIDLDGPNRTVEEPDRKNNYTGFHYYILDRQNPAPPAGAASRVPLPVPDDGSLLRGDEACDPPSTVLLQQRYSFNDILFPDGVPLGAMVDIEFEASNFGQTQQSGIVVCSTLLGKCLPLGTLAPGESKRLPAKWPAPKKAGQAVARASAISAEGGTSEASPMLIVVGCEPVIVREPVPNPNPSGPSLIGVGGSAVRHFQVVERDGATPVPDLTVVVAVRKGNGAPDELIFGTDAEGYVGVNDDEGRFRRGVWIAVGENASVGDVFTVQFVSIDGEGDCISQVQFNVEVVDRTYQATFAAGPALKIGGKYAGFDVAGRTSFGVEGAIDATLREDKQLFVASTESYGAEIGLKASSGTDPVQLGFDFSLPSASAGVSLGVDILTSDKFLFSLPLTQATGSQVANILGKSISDWATTIGLNAVAPGIGLAVAVVLDELYEELTGLDQYRYSTAAALGLNVEGTLNADLFRFQTDATDKVKVGTGLAFGLRSSAELAVFLGAEVQARENPQLIVPSIDTRASFALNAGFEAVLEKVDDPIEKAKLKKIADDWNDEFKGSADLAAGMKQEIAIDAETGEIQSATVTVSEKKKYGLLIDDEKYFDGGDGARRSYAFKVTNKDKDKLNEAVQHLVIGNALNVAGVALSVIPGANVLAMTEAASQILQVFRLADEYEKTVEIVQAKEKPYDLLKTLLPWKKALDEAKIATFELKLKFDVATKYTTEKGVIKKGVIFPLEVYNDPDTLIPANSTDRVTLLLFDALEKSLEPITNPIRNVVSEVTTVADQALAFLDRRFSPSGVRLTINAAAEPVKPFDVNLAAFQYRAVPAGVAPLVQDDMHVTGRGDIPHNGIGGFFTFGPPRTLAAPATLEIFYLDEEVAGLDEASLAVYRMTPAGTWQYLGGTVNAVENKVTTQITDLGTFTVAPPMPVGRPAVTAQVTPAPAPDAAASAVFTSDVIRLNTGQVVPDGTLFTVMTTAAGATRPVQVGTITTDDADPSTPGVQVASQGGRLSFRGEYNALRPAVTVLGWAARGGTTFFDTTVSLATP